MSDDELMIFGRALSSNNQPDNLRGVPKATWNKHVLVTGTIGAGKSTTTTTALASGHRHTDGATIVIDPKGGDWPTELARTQYALTDSLDDVYYLDLAEVVPAVSYFDVRRDIAAGVPRHRAVTDIIDHFLELLEHVKPADTTAIRAPDVIRYLLVALFDPIHGEDAFPLSDLFTAIQDLRQHRQTPDVQPEWSEQLLASLTRTDTQSFSKIVDGASTRVEKFYGNNYLRPIYDEVPADPADAFAFDELLEQDIFLIIDISGPEQQMQKIIANLLLGHLWRALRRRKQQQTTPPMTLLAIDEVPQLDIEAQLSEFLRMGREFNLGVIPMMQYPAQLGTDGTATTQQDSERIQSELLNDIHSVVAGRISETNGIEQKLATGQLTPSDVQQTLNNLPHTRWLFKPATPRGVDPAPTHQIADPPLPPGHPDGDRPLSEADQTAFEQELEACRARTAEQLGRPYDDYTADAFGASPVGPATDEQLHATCKQTNYATTLPLIEDLPEPVAYDPETSSLVCTDCGQQRRASFKSLLDTIRCHHSLADIDREEIPPVELGLTMSEAEIEGAPISVRQLCALQVIANINKGLYHQLEVDIVHDKLSAVIKRLGLESKHISQMSTAGLISVDHLSHYSYYTITPDGRELLNESHRHGVEWGPGEQDLAGSLLHQVMVEALRRYIQTTYADDPDSPVTETAAYYKPADHGVDLGADIEARVIYDVVGLTADGTIHVVGEAERANNDAATAALDDYYAMAAAEPEDALWITPSDSKGYDAVIEPLADPSPTETYPDPEPVIDAQSEGTNLKHHTYDQPGITGIYKLTDIRNMLEAPTVASLAETARQR